MELSEAPLDLYTCLSPTQAKSSFGFSVFLALNGWERKKITHLKLHTTDVFTLTEAITIIQTEEENRNEPQPARVGREKKDPSAGYRISFIIIVFNRLKAAKKHRILVLCRYEFKCMQYASMRRMIGSNTV